MESGGCGSTVLAFGTLLGFEATGPGDWLGSHCSFGVGLVGWWGVVSVVFLSLTGGPVVFRVCWWGLGLLFENYIVDASIL